MSKTEKLLRAFEKGQHLTARQITARFKLVNPRAAVSNIRIRHGVNVAINKGKNGSKYSVAVG
jgi:hypothetical protein